MTKINEENARQLISAVLSQVDIRVLVSEYTELSQQGSDVTGACPLNGCNNGLLRIKANLRFFKCDSCSQIGDVITFVQRAKGATFLEAVEYLVDKFEISSVNN